MAFSFLYPASSSSPSSSRLAWLSLLCASLLCFAPTVCAASQKPLSTDQDGVSTRGWALGDPIAVECLNRTIETGEHVTDDDGHLQYIPFWRCKESGRPLELSFGSEKDVNCTIAEVDDPLFHILEFYVHNDAPLSCRVPSLPPAAHGGKLGTAVEYIHLQVALTGTLQMSHIHINPQLNVLFHTTEAKLKKANKEQEEEDKSKKKKKDTSKAKDGNTGAQEGQIIAAAAYSLPPTTNSPKLIIGDPLPLTFRVRWYSTAVLPPSTSKIASGLGGHVHLSTAAYCLLSFGAGLAVSIAYFRGIDMPRRLKRYGAEKLGGGGDGRAGGYGYAYVPGGFPAGGYTGGGKRD